jgi:hypothetical protein
VLIQPKDNLGTRLELCSIMYVKKITLGRTEVGKAKVENWSECRAQACLNSGNNNFSRSSAWLLGHCPVLGKENERAIRNSPRIARVLQSPVVSLSERNGLHLSVTKLSPRNPCGLLFSSWRKQKIRSSGLLSTEHHQHGQFYIWIPATASHASSITGTYLHHYTI